MKTSMYTALKSAESIVKDNTMNYKEYEYLQATHYNAWKSKEIQPILSGKPDFKSTGSVRYVLTLTAWAEAKSQIFMET